MAPIIHKITRVTETNLCQHREFLGKT